MTGKHVHRLTDTGVSVTGLTQVITEPHCNLLPFTETINDNRWL